MAAAAGMTSAIMNPLHVEDMSAVRAANVLLGHDPDCRTWLKTNRDPNAAAASAEGGEGRRARGERRRRRSAA